jgi:hypothetical protein
MCATKWSAITLIGAAAALFAPLGANGAEAGGGAPVTLNLIPAIGREAVTVSGMAPAARPVEATVYATFSENLPTVLLSRRIIPTDAAGHYMATLSHAPAFFRGAIVKIVVRSLPAGAFAEAQFPVYAPNVPAPPDAWPPDYRYP